jgi:hypothetical protein
MDIHDGLRIEFGEGVSGAFELGIQLQCGGKGSACGGLVAEFQMEGADAIVDERVGGLA